MIGIDGTPGRDLNPESGEQFPFTQTQPRNGIGLGIIGSGRVGSVLGHALRALGYEIVGVHARSELSLERAELLLPGAPVLPVDEIVARADLVLLSVPDDALESVVESIAAQGKWRPGQLVIHTAGRFGIGALAPASARGTIPLAIHPAMTFSGTGLDLGRIAGAAFAITAPAVAMPLARALVEELGGVAVPIAEGDRELYHAALAHGSNHGAVLVAQAARALVEAGVTDPMAVLAPLVNASVEGVLRSGEAALTGPVVRGDLGTVAAHLAALSELSSTHPEDSDIEAGYRAMGAITVRRVISGSHLGESDGARMLNLLANDETGATTR